VLPPASSNGRGARVSRVGARNLLVLAPHRGTQNGSSVSVGLDESIRETICSEQFSVTDTGLTYLFDPPKARILSRSRFDPPYPRTSLPNVHQKRFHLDARRCFARPWSGDTFVTVSVPRRVVCNWLRSLSMADSAPSGFVRDRITRTATTTIPDPGCRGPVGKLPYPT